MPACLQVSSTSSISVGQWVRIFASPLPGSAGSSSNSSDGGVAAASSAVATQAVSLQQATDPLFQAALAASQLGSEPAVPLATALAAANGGSGAASLTAWRPGMADLMTE